MKMRSLSLWPDHGLMSEYLHSYIALYSVNWERLQRIKLPEKWPYSSLTRSGDWWLIKWIPAIRPSMLRFIALPKNIYAHHPPEAIKRQGSSRQNISVSQVHGHRPLNCTRPGTGLDRVGPRCAVSQVALHRYHLVACTLLLMIFQYWQPIDREFAPSAVSAFPTTTPWVGGN